MSRKYDRWLPLTPQYVDMLDGTQNSAAFPPSGGRTDHPNVKSNSRKHSLTSAQRGSTTKGTPHAIHTATSLFDVPYPLDERTPVRKSSRSKRPSGPRGPISKATQVMERDGAFAFYSSSAPMEWDAEEDLVFIGDGAEDSNTSGNIVTDTIADSGVSEPRDPPPRSRQPLVSSHSAVPWRDAVASASGLQPVTSVEGNPHTPAPMLAHAAPATHTAVAVLDHPHVNGHNAPAASPCDTNGFASDHADDGAAVGWASGRGGVWGEPSARPPGGADSGDAAGPTAPLPPADVDAAALAPAVAAVPPQAAVPPPAVAVDAPPPTASGIPPELPIVRAAPSSDPAALRQQFEALQAHCRDLRVVATRMSCRALTTGKLVSMALNVMNGT